MKRTWISLVLAGLVQACAGPGDGPGDEAVAGAIRRALPSTSIDAIRPSPVPGLVEVVAGRNVLYASASGRYLVIGHIYDLQAARDLTAERKAELARIAWDRLPLDAAVRYGQGALKVAVFHDPDCPWCRRLHRELRATGDIEVYQIMYPVPALHPAARGKAVAILCHGDPAEASDRAAAGHDLDAPPAGCAESATAAVDRAMAFGRAHGIQGTPTLVAPDGRVHNGYLPVPRLKAWLQAGRESSPTEPTTQGGRS